VRAVKWILLITILAVSLGFTTDVSQAVAFADHLFASGDYQSAALEYKRCLFRIDSTVSDRALSKQCIAQIARCYYQQGDYELVYDYIEAALSDSSLDMEIRAELNRFAGLSCLRSGFYRTARLYFARNDNDTLRLLTAFVNLPLADWEEAQTSLDQAKNSSVEDIRQSAFGLDTTLSDLRRLRLKSPAAAALMSAMIPGAGHAYAGYYQTGFASLLLNAALIGSSVELVRHDLRIAGGTVSLLAFGWYMGNVYGSYTAALKTNRTRRAMVMEEFERKNGYLFK